MWRFWAVYFHRVVVVTLVIFWWQGTVIIMTGKLWITTIFENVFFPWKGEFILTFSDVPLLFSYLVSMFIANLGTKEHCERKKKVCIHNNILLYHLSFSLMATDMDTSQHSILSVRNTSKSSIKDPSILRPTHIRHLALLTTWDHN